MKKITTVEEYIEVNTHFGEQLNMLRNIINSTELLESVKWNAPVYTYEGKNVLGLGAFKHHFCIWFFNGVFLKDENGRLEQAQETTKALRQMRFDSTSQINKNLVLSYINEAIENQKVGKVLKLDIKNKVVIIPDELNTALQNNSVFQDAFKLLTPAKQREYANYVDSAKKEATKLSRIAKIKPMIIKGIGLNDKYKNC